MKRFSLRYTLLTYRLDLVWFPLTFWMLFIIIGVIVERDEIMNVTRAYLGGAAPLVAGVMAAYAVLEDPALELRFSTPTRPAAFLTIPLGLTFALQACLALSFQAVPLLVGGDFSMYQSVWHVQLAWLLPTLALMAVGSLTALAAAQATVGALVVGTVWIVELMARGWLAQNSGMYVLVFMGALMPDHPDLVANHLSLAALSLVFLLAAWRLLHRQERYI